MFSFLQYLTKKPSAKSMAQTELEDNQRSLLQYESQALYNIKMAEYYEANIERLVKYIQGA